MKKFISLLLTLTMCMSMLPVSVFSIDEDLNVSDAISNLLSAEESNILTSSNFPDACFLNKLSEIYPDGLSQEEAEAVRTLDISDSDISSVEGIKLFTNLYTLEISGNNLDDIDLSNMNNLYTIYAEGKEDENIPACSMNSLNISGCTAIYSVHCSGTGLETFNAAGSSLAYPYLSNNNLTDVDFSNCSSLSYVYLDHNSLTQIDLSGLPALSYVYLGQNSLSSVNFANCTLLDHVYLEENNFTNIDLSWFSGCSNLQMLTVSDNKIAYFDTASFTYNPGSQKITVQYSLTDQGLALINLCDIVGSSRISYVSVSDDGDCLSDGELENGEYDSSTGLLYYPADTTSFSYTFDTQQESYRYMEVEVTLLLADDSYTLSRYKSVIPSNSYYYRGTSIVPEYSQNIKIYCYETGELLEQDEDYTVEYSDPVNVGMCKVTVRGINGYDGINGEPSGSLYASDGSLQGSFSISQRSLTNRVTITLKEATVALEDGEYLYTGEEICPEITVTCFMDDDHVVYPGMTDWPYVGNTTLTKDKDYTVNYSNNIEPGDAKIIVEGIGNFCSTVTAEFKILPTIKLPSSVTEIGSQAFCNTTAEAIVIPQGCQYIATDAFDNCPNLKYIINYSSVNLSSIDGVSIYNVCV